MPTHVHAQIRLCPDTFVPRHVCAQTRLRPDTFVLRHVCAQTHFYPDSFVPRLPCAHACSCPDTFVPRRVCAQTRLCPHTFVTRHICAHTLYSFLGINVSGHKRVWVQSCGHSRVGKCGGTIRLNEYWTGKTFNFFLMTWNSVKLQGLWW